MEEGADERERREKEKEKVYIPPSNYHPIDNIFSKLLNNCRCPLIPAKRQKYPYKFFNKP
jgi:hypothetical protein